MKKKDDEETRSAQKYKTCRRCQKEFLVFSIEFCRNSCICFSCYRDLFLRADGGQETDEEMYRRLKFSNTNGEGLS